MHASWIASKGKLDGAHARGLCRTLGVRDTEFRRVAPSARSLHTLRLHRKRDRSKQSRETRTRDVIDGPTCLVEPNARHVKLEAPKACTCCARISSAQRKAPYWAHASE